MEGGPRWGPHGLPSWPAGWPVSGISGRLLRNLHQANAPPLQQRAIYNYKSNSITCIQSNIMEAKMETIHPITPIVVAIAAVLAFITLRNSDIATRSRLLKEELLYKNIVDGSDVNFRRWNINTQILIFLLRYIITSACCIMLSGSFYYLIKSYNYQRNMGADEIQNYQDIGFDLFKYAIILYIIELAIGPITLYLNGRQKKFSWIKSSKV